MGVGTYALTSREEAKAYVGDSFEKDGMTVYFSCAASTATAQVLNNHLILIHDNQTDANIDLTAVAYDTVAELVAYINTSVTGWVARAIYPGPATSADLVKTGQLNAKGSDNEVTLKIAENYIIDKLIDRATDLIERWCNRKLMSRSYLRETYDGPGTQYLLLDQYPVTAVQKIQIGRVNIASVYNTSATTFAALTITNDATTQSIGLNVDGTITNVPIPAAPASISTLITTLNTHAGWTVSLLASTYTDFIARELLPRQAGMYCKDPYRAYMEMPFRGYLTDYHLQKGPDETRNPGIIFYIGGFTSGWQNVFVDYTAGYTTAPAALEMACLELVKYKYDQLQHDRSITTERLGDYGYTLADLKKGLPEDMVDELSLFKKLVIGASGLQADFGHVL